MNLQAWLHDPVGHLKKYFDLGVICFNEVGRFDDCDQVWVIFGTFAGLICIIGLAFVVRHIYRDYAAHQRYRKKKLLELEIAPIDVMKEHTWNDDKLVDPTLSQDEIVRRIKYAKASQRMSDSSRPTGNPEMGIGPRRQ
ncbi:MAG: hypothetical protein ABI771_09050 [Betaproteobacteria bacterium]